MNNITFEKAKEMATKEASKHGKIIEKIEENNEYWLIKAGFEDGHRDFDSGFRDFDSDNSFDNFDFCFTFASDSFFTGISFGSSC